MSKRFGVDLPHDLEGDVAALALKYANAMILYHIDGDRASLNFAAFLHDELNDRCREAANSVVDVAGVV
jgi:hypothetical protein